MTAQPWRHWRHVVKLDPARHLEDDVLAAIGHSGTDAVLIGGTQDITYDNVNRLLGRLRRFAGDVPLWQEISGEDSVVDGVDGYAIPVVLNAGRTDWLIGAHAGAIRRYGAFIDWQKVLVEGYLVLNEGAAVAQLTEANTHLTREQLASYITAGEALFSMPVLYLEYSGIYGDPAQVAAACQAARHAHIFYGGGIDTYDKAYEMSRHADTIIVGNALYRPNWQDVLRETIRAAND